MPTKRQPFERLSFDQELRKRVLGLLESERTKAMSDPTIGGLLQSVKSADAARPGTFSISLAKLMRQRLKRVFDFLEQMLLVPAPFPQICVPSDIQDAFVEYVVLREDKESEGLNMFASFLSEQCSTIHTHTSELCQSVQVFPWDMHYVPTIWTGDEESRLEVVGQVHCSSDVEAGKAAYAALLNLTVRFSAPGTTLAFDQSSRLAIAACRTSFYVCYRIAMMTPIHENRHRHALFGVRFFDKGKLAEPFVWLPELINYFLIDQVTEKSQMKRRLQNSLSLLSDAENQRTTSVKIAICVAAMESLLASGGEVSSAFVQNGARLLEPDPHERHRAEQFLKVAYNARSKVLHGDAPKDLPDEYEIENVAAATVLTVIQWLKFLRSMGIEPAGPSELIKLLQERKYQSGPLEGVQEMPVVRYWRPQPDEASPDETLEGDT